MGRIILQIDACKNTGSTGKISEDIGRVAIKHGWNSWKVYSRMRQDNQPSKSHLIATGTKVGFYLSVLETRLFDNHCLGLSNIYSTKQLIRKIDEINPDIIQLHDIKGYFLNIKTLFEYLSTKKIPVVWTMHSCWQFTGHCGHFDHIGCERWKEGCYNCPLKKGYPESWLIDRSKRNWREKRALFTSVDKMTLVPVSDWLSGFVADSFLKDVPRVVIHNGIDINDFCIKSEQETKSVKNKYGIEDKFTILGVAAPWTKLKGIEDYYKLRELLPEDCQIVMVGLSESQLERLPKGIVGIKRTESREEMAALYTLADLFFNSTYEDNFPTVNIEALACGTPVCTYQTGGSVEAIDTETGFVISQGGYAKLPEIVNQIKEKGKDYYQEKCRKRAVTHYDKDKCFEEYMGLYDKILANK